MTLESNAQHYGRLNKAGHPCAYYGDHPDWLIVAGQHRDRSILEQANFEATRKALEAIDAPNVEVESASHWAVGWVESLIINPACPALIKEAEAIAAALTDYPVVDDELFSSMEQDAMEEAWGSWGSRNFRRYLAQAFGEAWAPYLEDVDADRLWILFTENGGEWDMDNDGPNFRWDACRVEPWELFGDATFDASDVHGFPSMVRELEAWAVKVADYAPSDLEWHDDRLGHVTAYLETQGYLAVERAHCVEVWDTASFRGAA